jgi:hypothetical protein
MGCSQWPWHGLPFRVRAHAIVAANGADRGGHNQALGCVADRRRAAERSGESRQAGQLLPAFTRYEIEAEHVWVRHRELRR